MTKLLIQYNYIKVVITFCADKMNDIIADKITKSQVAACFDRF